MKFSYAFFCLLGMSLVNAEMMAGGWHKIDSNSLQSLKENDQFSKVVQKCQEAYLKQNPQNSNVSLGDIQSVETQVVAGINYKIYFENQNGQQSECFVFVQSWTNTIEVTNFNTITDSEQVRKQ